MRLSSAYVLGTPLLVTNYESLAAQCLIWARQPNCMALEFANTQIITMRRHEPAFREITASYDHFLPDGMPLIWCMNRAGAGLDDRVYGPTFMRKFLERVPGNNTHYLMGGSREACSRLQENLSRVNPSIKFVGGFHGKCNLDGSLEAKVERAIIDEVNRLAPDFIWVGFGAPKQQAWTRRYKSRIRRGVILTVGFAFDVNAGTKRDAPERMQRLGLTWLYRLWSEPRRLGPRYLKYNSLFLFYLFWDGLRGRAWSAPVEKEAEFS